MPGFRGTPPACRPQCVGNSECKSTEACESFKCVNPCVNRCGINAECHVINHNPICACIASYTGDPFTKCYPQTVLISETYNEPCVPSPCGPFSECKDNGGIASCSCTLNYIGAPPSCRPECSVNTDCLPSMACINEKCRNPCPGSCGLNAHCYVRNHLPICKCDDNYAGDAFTECKYIGMLLFLKYQV